MINLNFNLICLSAFLVVFFGCNNETTTNSLSHNNSVSEVRTTKATVAESAENHDHEPENKDVSQQQDESANLMDSISPVASMITTPESSLFSGQDLFVNSMRTWNDVSNTYSTNAELLEVKMKQRQVRLLKENGIVVVVDYELLSDHDKNFVRQFIQHHRNQDVSSAPKLVNRRGQ